MHDFFILRFNTIMSCALKMKHFLVFTAATLVASASFIRENLGMEPTFSTIGQAPYSSNYSTTCGGKLLGTQGRIDYKVNETYNNNERCIWTFRTPYRSKINFNLLTAGFESGFDDILIKTLNSSGVENSYMFLDSGDLPKSVVLNGTVAIIIFQSDYSNTGLGFSLSFTSEGFDPNLLYYTDQNQLVSSYNKIRFPESGQSRNLELSTIVLFGRYGDGETAGLIEVNITSVDLEVGEDGKCRDVLHLYQIADDGGPPPHTSDLMRLSPENGTCLGTDFPDGNKNIRAYGIVAILATDQQRGSNGFELEASPFDLYNNHL